MQENCPNCQAMLVPSVVGYLCSECGSVHRFYKTDPKNDKVSGSDHRLDSSAEPTDKSATPHHKTSGQPDQQPDHSSDHSHKHDQGMPSTKPVNKPTGGYSDDDLPTSPPAESFPRPNDDHLEPMSTPDSQANQRHDHAYHHLEPNNAEDENQPPVIDQQALTEARHYRKKLRHRLKTMVVPELPSPYGKKELNSSYDDQIDTPLPPRPADSIPKYADPYHYKDIDDKSNEPQIKENLPNMTIESVSMPHPVRNGLLIILIIALLGGATFVIMQKKQSNNSTISQAPSQTVSSPPQASTTKTNDNQDAVKRDDIRKKDLKEIATALEVYRRDTGSYPAGGDISALYPLQYTNPPYISYINYDPSSTDANKIKYGYSSDGANFKLTAKLEILTDLDAKDGIYTVTNTKN